MASIFDRIAKRAAFPVEINGGTIHVCEPTYSDIDRVRAMEPAKPSDEDPNPFDGRTAMTLALCVVNEDGSPAFPKVPGESDLDLAKRVDAAMRPLTVSALKAIQDAIQKLVKPVDAEELAKN